MIKPLGERVLVEPISRREEKIGSIFVPEGAGGRGCTATVIAVGNEQKEVKCGDRVIYGSGNDNKPPLIKLEGKEYLMLSEDNILAIVTNEKEIDERQERVERGIG